MNKEYFNRDYYKRFYLNAKTRIRDKKNIPVLAGFIFSYLRHLGLPLRNVLDVGCSLGEWKQSIYSQCPKTKYDGIEYSEYLCKKFDWKQGSVVDFSLKKKYDLVICQSVLQYLPSRDTLKAIHNLALHCRGALYLEVVTKKDWHHHCDQNATDDAIRLRTGTWYRRELSKYFRSIGGGLFLVKDAPAILWELEGV